MAITADLLDRALAELDAVHLLHDDDRGADPLVAQALHQKAAALVNEVNQGDAATLDGTRRQALEVIDAVVRQAEGEPAAIIARSSNNGRPIERVLH